jgi:hypothetical protein
MRLPLSALVAILPFYLDAVLAQGPSGSGKTTRYWDCWYVLVFLLPSHPLEIQG